MWETISCPLSFLNKLLVNLFYFIFILDDKDALANERKRLAKESSNTQESCSTPKTGSKSRKELFPTPPDSAKTSSRESFTPETPQEVAVNQPSADKTPPSSSSDKKRRNGSSAVEKVSFAIFKKIYCLFFINLAFFVLKENKRLRLENHKMKEEAQCLQQKVNELEKELNEMSRDLAAYENENMELKEKIESMDMDPATSNLKLAEGNLKKKVICRIPTLSFLIYFIFCSPQSEYWNP